MGNFFYKLSLWEKILICIGAFSTVSTGVYTLLLWIDKITGKFFLNPTVGNNILVGFIFLILGLGVTYIVLYAKSLFPQIKKFIKWFFSKNKGILIIHGEIEEEHREYVTGYKSGLGEIEAYWGNRNAANVRIKDLLKSTNGSEIFIAAIGFSTIEVLDDSEIINHFAELIENSALKITIVSPKNIAQLKNARPEVKEEILTKNFNKGQLLLKSVKTKLSSKLQGKDIDNHLEFRCYDTNTIPRHFILQDNKTIFFGSYLSSETGSNSYLMELCNNQQENHKKELAGLYNLFIKEINNIKKNSTKKTFK